MEFPSQFKDNADASTGLLFIRVYNLWHTTIRRELHKLGITHPQFVLLTSLNYLSQTDTDVSQANLAKMADMDVMTVSQILRGLEKKGFVRRISSDRDSRANDVLLLPKGQEMVSLAMPIVIKVDDIIFGVLKDHESTFREYLQMLRKQGEQYGEILG